MGQKLIVGISDWKVGRGDDVLITYALGSCIGTCLYDKTTGISGLSHIMLPDSRGLRGSEKVGKFADTAVPAIIEEMLKKGAVRHGACRQQRRHHP